MMGHKISACFFEDILIHLNCSVDVTNFIAVVNRLRRSSVSSVAVGMSLLVKINNSFHVSGKMDVHTKLRQATLNDNWLL